MRYFRVFLQILLDIVSLLNYNQFAVFQAYELYPVVSYHNLLINLVTLNID